MTDAERRLWYHLRRRNLGGSRFRRQAPIGPFIVDFVCFDGRLILELDGSQHAQQTEADAKRTAWLNSQGFRVLRVWNNQVLEELESVLEAIGSALAEQRSSGHHATPLPNPPPQGGREL
jgi:very-short-patch-repair endonuclease